MSDPYIGEIRMFAGNFAPQGWLFCQGQTLSISENDVLFNLIGTTYGGDGQTNFKLPDLQSRLAINQGSDPSGNTYAMGQTGGFEQVNLNTSQLATHTHLVAANNNANSGTAPSGAGAIFAAPGDTTLLPYGSGSSLTYMSPKATTNSGGGQPHANIKPYLCVNFIIALTGIYPSPN